MEGPIIVLSAFPFAKAVLNKLFRYTVALPGSMFRALRTQF